MDNYDILNICRQFLPPQASVKCILSDQLPREFKQNINKYEINIVNTLTTGSNDIMGHWIMLVKTRDLLYYFDPFGLPPYVYNNYISSYIKVCSNHIKCLRWNRQIQNINTLVCGAHCLFKLYLIIKYDDIFYAINQAKVIYHKKKFLYNNGCRSIF